MSVTEAEEFFGAGEARTPAAHAILDRLADVGLGYLSLGQPLTTLSGGERQRLKLATQMAEKGGVYVWIIDLGPGAGHDGGRIVFEGTPADLVAARSTLTGEHLAAYVGT
jgi:excinuclease UvrABC ATPase subunit